MDMEPIEQLDVVQANAQRVISRLMPDHMGLSCPCEGWDVAMLVDKMVTSAVLFGTSCRGAEPRDDVNLLFPEPIGRDDPAGSFAAAASACRDAFEQSRLEGEMMGPLGVMVPRRAGLDVRMTDCTVNTWDLAVAIGVDHGIDTDVAVSLAEFGRGIFPKVRQRQDHARFGEPLEVSDGHPVVELIALTGRDPNWSASAA